MSASETTNRGVRIKPTTGAPSGYYPTRLLPHTRPKTEAEQSRAIYPTLLLHKNGRLRPYAVPLRSGLCPHGALDESLLAILLHPPLQKFPCALVAHLVYYL